MATIASMEATVKVLKQSLDVPKKDNQKNTDSIRQQGDEMLLSAARVADKAIENVIRQIKNN